MSAGACSRSLHGELSTTGQVIEEHCGEGKFKLEFKLSVATWRQHLGARHKEKVEHAKSARSNSTVHDLSFVLLND